VAGDQAYKERLMRQAFFMLLTTQGRIVLQGGDEIARTKPCGKNDPVPERSVQSKEALTFFCHDHFHENSYHSPDFTNRWDWARGKDFASLQKFVQGLVHLRRANSAWQARTVQEVQQRLHFLGRPENKVLDLPGDHARYRAWEDLKKLDLVFLNVPADWRGKTLYLAGGVHPADPNPRTPFAVHFDQNGRGVIHFTRAQIKKFNQGIWGKREEVQFKLVVAPGSWQVPYPLYQDNGCHSLSYQDILKGDVAVIDLGLSHHHRPGEIVYYPQNIIAFTLANTPGAQNLGPAGATPLPFPELLIIHYAGDEKTSFPLPAGPTWQWLADSGTGELWPQLQKTSGEIKNNTITLEGHCSVMLGRGRKTASAKKRHH
jgi:hypothetical protein